MVVRDKRNPFESFPTSAEYLQDVVQEALVTTSFCNLGIELTRPSRAISLWFTLQIIGLDEIGRTSDHRFKLAEHAEVDFRN